MTQKIYNDGVKIIGLALRSMIKSKEAQRSEDNAVEMYWKEGTAYFPRIRNLQAQIELLQAILDNVDGCNELLPIHQAPEQAAPAPISVGSAEERTELLRQIADLESKLEQASKSFEVKGDELDKANFYVRTRGEEIERLNNRIKILESSGPQWGEMTYEAVCQKNDKMRQEYLQVEAENDRLRDQNNNLALELAKHIDGSKELLKINTTLNERCDAYGMVNSQLSTTNANRALCIQELESKIKSLEQKLSDAERHLNASFREEGITNRALNKARETIKELTKVNAKVCDDRDSLAAQVTTMCKTCDKIADERDGLRRGLDRKHNLLCDAQKVVKNLVKHTNQLRNMVFAKLAPDVNKMIAELEGEGIDLEHAIAIETKPVWASDSEPPKHWDCSRDSVAAAPAQFKSERERWNDAMEAMSASTTEKVNQATPVDTGAVKEDIKNTMTVKLHVDTSELDNVFIGEPKSLTVDHDQMIVEIYVDKDAQADTLRKCADKVEARHLRG